MKYIVTINDKSYEVEVEKGQATIVKTTQIAAQPIKEIPVPAVAEAPAHLPSAVPGELIKAPMPGGIVDIKVQAGAAVKKCEVLIILEAMKMENEITAPRDGIVAQIIVAKGASVSTGDILLALQ